MRDLGIDVESSQRKSGKGLKEINDNSHEGAQKILQLRQDILLVDILYSMNRYAGSHNLKTRPWRIRNRIVTRF